MSYTLGIDTSYEVAVGLARDGQPLDSIVVPDTRAHAEALLPSVLELCARHGCRLDELADVAVGMGPGPFTGLRVGIVTAWTIASVLGVPPRGVCSLDVVARQWTRLGAPSEFVVASDARRKELYWARYADGVRVDGPNVTSADLVPSLPLAGPALDLHPDLTDPRRSAPRRLDAAVLAAEWAAMPALAEPAYLRAADATVSTRTKSALPRPSVRRR